MNASIEDEYRKACEKYGGTPPDPERDAAISRRRWRIFLAIEAMLVVVAVVLFKFGGKSEVRALAFSILGSWLCFSLPVAFLYLIGKPPVMSLEIFDSPLARAMTRDVLRRVPLSVDDFYIQFYDSSGISKDTVARIRQRLLNIDKASDRLVPGDYLPVYWEYLDFGDVFYVLGQEFAVTFGNSDYDAFTGTLDSLIRLVHDKIQRTSMRG